VGSSAVLVISALGLQSLYAERESTTVVYHGVSLGVEERLSAGGDLLKVVLAGEAFLVSVPEAPRQVALRYLTRPELSTRLSGQEIESLAIISSQQGDAEVLKAAVQVGMTSPAAKEFESSGSWQKLMDNAQMEAVVWGAVQSVGERAPENRLCAVSAAVESRLQEEQRAGQGAPSDASERPSVSERVANTCMTRALVNTFEKLWGGRVGLDLADELQRDSAPFMKKVGARSSTVSSIEDSLRSLARAVEQVDSARFEELLERLSRDSESIEVRPDATLARQVFLGRAVMAGASRSAVEQLAKVSFEQRSSLTHSQLVKALRGLPSSDWMVLLDSGVRPAIVRYVAKDEEIYSQWIATHRRVIIDLVEVGKVDSAWSVGATVLKEDPVVASKVLSDAAKLIVQGYIDQGSVAKAEQAAGELAPWLPWTTGLRLLLARRGLSISGICGVLVALAVVVQISLNRKRRKGETKRSDASGEDGTIRSTASEPSARVDVTNKDERPADHLKFSGEYLASLRLFGLEPGATLAQIKNAYRTAVKQYHPDRAGGGTAGDTDLFIRLTSEYEKLLELHELEAHSIEPILRQDGEA
jgi:hypothetical protein